MDNYEEEIADETVQTQDDEVVEVQAEETEEEEVDYKAKYEEEKKAREKAEQTIIKAKSKPKTDTAPKIDGKLTTFDLLALQKANIETEEDLDEVVRWADYNKITVAEALKSNILKATLAEKAQIRTSAMAVNTGTGRRAGGGVSEERLMADAQKGIMPESPEDIAKLARMRIGKK